MISKLTYLVGKEHNDHPSHIIQKMNEVIEIINVINRRTGPISNINKLEEKSSDYIHGHGEGGLLVHNRIKAIVENAVREGNLEKKIKEYFGIL